MPLPFCLLIQQVGMWEPIRGKTPSPAASKMKDYSGEQLCLARFHLKGYDKDPNLLWKGEMQEGTLPQHGL